MAVEIRVPALGESIVDAVVANWLKREGESVSQGEALVELETDKINLEVFAEQSGVLQKIGKQPGDVVSVGDVLGMIGEAASVSAPAVPPTPVADVTSTPSGPLSTPSGPLSIDGHRAPSPLAKRIAAEYNVDLSQVRRNTPPGPLTRYDVINYLEQSKSGPLPAF